MEKTLRKCGTSSANVNAIHLDIDSIPFDIPKRYQIQVQDVGPYDLNMDMFSYDFSTEEDILISKAQREEEIALRVAQQVDQDKLKSSTSSDTSDDVEVLDPEPHPTNPFLSYSGQTLIPTLTTVTTAPSKILTKDENDDIVNFFDAQNTNPFDGTELQSISNIDALRSVLAPNYVHDFSTFEKGAPVPPLSELSPQSTINTDPIYATVNKPPKKIISASIERGSSIEVVTTTVNNGYPTIHSSYTALGTSGTFSVEPPASHKVPEEVVARVTQRLNHDQDACFAFLKDVLKLMEAHNCDGGVAESVCMMSESEKERDEMVILIKQFSELGFSSDNIVVGLSQHPTDRDALLDHLTSR